MVSIFKLTLVVLAIVSTIYTHPASVVKSHEDWPEECKGQYYCWVETAAYKKLAPTFEKLLKGETLYQVLGSETDDRDGPVDDDVAGCKYRGRFHKITMIRDEKNVTWYVPQTANFTLTVQTRECESPNVHITPQHNTSLDIEELNKPFRKVRCIEQKIMFKFPVLSQNGLRIEPESLSPHKGLPVYCSAKVTRKIRKITPH